MGRDPSARQLPTAAKRARHQLIWDAKKRARSEQEQPVCRNNRCPPVGLEVSKLLNSLASAPGLEASPLIKGQPHAQNNDPIKEIVNFVYVSRQGKVGSNDAYQRPQGRRCKCHSHCRRLRSPPRSRLTGPARSMAAICRWAGTQRGFLTAD
jgi:hypothetical protein